MEPLHNYVNRRLHLADEALSDARYLLKDGRHKAAVNRAYYAMFHAVQAALAGVEPRSPKTHSGALGLFGKHFVKTGRIDKRFATHLHDVFELRQDSDYEINREAPS